MSVEPADANAASSAAEPTSPMKANESDGTFNDGYDARREEMKRAMQSAWTATDVATDHRLLDLLANAPDSLVLHTALFDVLQTSAELADTEHIHHQYELLSQQQPCPDARVRVIGTGVYAHACLRQ